MRKFLIAGSIAASSLVLVGCQQSRSDNAAASSESGSWDETNVQDIRKAIDRRAARGLDHQPFAFDAKDPATITKAALRYASALSQGAADPTKLYKVYTLPRPKVDLRAGLLKAMADGHIADWLESLAPQTDNYRNLS